jgi:hypothetical protein
MSSWFDLPIKAAKAGDDVAARALVRYLAVCLERGEVPPAALVEYFVPALKQIAAGRCSADEVLGTSGKHAATFKQDYGVAREVWILNHRAKDHLPLKDSMKKEGAFSKVGKNHHRSGEWVKEIYWRMKPLVEAEFLDQPMDDEARRRFEVDQHIVLGQLVETLKKRGSD